MRTFLQNLLNLYATLSHHSQGKMEVSIFLTYLSVRKVKGRLGGDQHILEYKLSRDLGLAGDPADLEYKLSKYLGLAATTNPGMQAI